MMMMMMMMMIMLMPTYQLANQSHPVCQKCTYTTTRGKDRSRAITAGHVWSTARRLDEFPFRRRSSEIRKTKNKQTKKKKEIWRNGESRPDSRGLDRMIPCKQACVYTPYARIYRSAPSSTQCTPYAPSFSFAYHPGREGGERGEMLLCPTSTIYHPRKEEEEGGCHANKNHCQRRKRVCPSNLA